MPVVDEEDTKQAEPKRRRKTTNSSSQLKAPAKSSGKHPVTPDPQSSKKSHLPRHRRISDTLVRLSSGRRRKRSLGMTNDIPAETSDDRAQVFGEKCVADIKRCNQRLDHVLRSYQPGAKFSELDRSRREVALVAGQNETLTKQMDALEKSKKEQTGKLREQLEAERRLASRDKERLENEMAALTLQIDQQESKMGELRDSITDKDAQIADLTKINEDLQLKIDRLERQIEAMKTELALYMSKWQESENLALRTADQHRLDLEAEQKKYGELLKDKERLVREAYDDALAKKEGDFQDKMDDLETQNERLKNKCGKLLNEKAALCNDMGNLTQAMNNLRQSLEQQTIDGESLEVADLKKDNNDLKKQLDKKDREFGKMQLSYKQMANESAELKDEIHRLKTHVKRLEEKLAPHLYASPTRRLLFEQQKPLIFDTVSALRNKDADTAGDTTSTAAATPLTSHTSSRSGIRIGSHSKKRSDGKGGSNNNNNSDMPVRLTDVMYDTKNDIIVFALENYSLFEVEFQGIYLETNGLGIDRHELSGVLLKPSEKKKVCIGGHVKDASHWPVVDEARKSGLEAIKIFICDKYGGSIFLEEIPLDKPDSHTDGIPNAIIIDRTRSPAPSGGRGGSQSSAAGSSSSSSSSSGSGGGGSHGKSRFSKGKAQRKR